MSDITMGIYMIKNKVDGKFYIGSSVNMKERQGRHLRGLRQNKHHSIYLQRAWNKYGEDNFEFLIVEVVESRDKLLEREQYYLDKYKCYTEDVGYNMSDKAWGTALYGESNHNYGKPMSEEQKRKLSLLAKERYKYSPPFKGKCHTEETKKKMSEHKKGKNNGVCGKNHPQYGKPRKEETKEKMRKLTSEQRLEVYKLKTSGVKAKDLAIKYDVKVNTIYRIIREVKKNLQPRYI